MGRGKSMILPEGVWERLKRKAEREGKPMTQIVSELLDHLDEIEDPEASVRECVFCGAPTPLGRRICDHCLYDPTVIRPQIMGALYYVWVMEMHELDPNFPTDFETFVNSVNREWATELGVTEAEWEFWLRYCVWRKTLKSDPSQVFSAEWKSFCHEALRNGFAGPKASWRTIVFMFGQKK